MQIRTGISDGEFTEVVEGLKEGDEVISGLTSEKSSGSKSISLFTGGIKIA